MNLPKIKGLRWETFVHILICVYIISSPVLFRGRVETEWNILSAIKTLYPPLSVCVIFYLNYFLLIPRYMTSKRKVLFVVYNIVILVSLTCFHEFLMAIMRGVNVHEIPPHHPDGKFPHPAPGEFRMMFFVRHLIGSAFVVLLAIVASLSIKWKAAEEARQKAELAKSEAELKNLKSQINPHFLLNTLNNIYALTEIDPQKAKRVIEELSKMLRYILYENQERTVPLTKEVDMIHTYIKLMEIRLAKGIKVEFDFKNDSSTQANIAPFIFMSLTENAFKHGITDSKNSFVKISIILTDSHLVYNCVNSCKEKNESKELGGLGLKQVAAQLEHFYPESHKWVKGYNERTGHYVSRIEIKLGQDSRDKGQGLRDKGQEPSEPQNFLTSEQTAGFSEPQNLKTKGQDKE